MRCVAFGIANHLGISAAGDLVRLAADLQQSHCFLLFEG
jgi:hypothetical protein